MQVHIHLDCEQSLILAMAIVGRAKYTRARESSRRRDAKGAPFTSRLLEISRALVYFARPTTAIAKIRDYSQSNIHLIAITLSYKKAKTNKEKSQIGIN